MNNEQKLEAMVSYYRQKLADEQLTSANLDVNLQEARQRIRELEEELEDARAESEGTGEDLA